MDSKSGALQRACSRAKTEVQLVAKQAALHAHDEASLRATRALPLLTVAVHAKLAAAASQSDVSSGQDEQTTQVGEADAGCAGAAEALQRECAAPTAAADASQQPLGSGAAPALLCVQVGMLVAPAAQQAADR
eukprot:3664142-Pleurochrysis_carterae.AAC.1